MGDLNITYRKLFWSTFQISACTFGGGFVIIPLLRKRFVEELGWIEEEEMLDMTAVAQSSPGAVAVNASILVGYHTKGIPGAMLAVLGTVLPPMLIISVIALFYQEFRDSPIVHMAMAGMLAGAAAVICDVVITMVQGILRQKRCFPVWIMLAAFAAVRVWEWNMIVVLLLCGAAGALDIWHQKKKEEDEDDLS